MPSYSFIRPLSTLILLTILFTSQTFAQDSCYINDSGFTCCSKSLGINYLLLFYLFVTEFRKRNEVRNDGKRSAFISGFHSENGGNKFRRKIRDGCRHG